METTLNVSVSDKLKGEKRSRRYVSDSSTDVKADLRFCFLESSKVKIDLDYCVLKTLPLSETICLVLNRDCLSVSKWLRSSRKEWDILFLPIKFSKQSLIIYDFKVKCFSVNGKATVIEEKELLWHFIATACPWEKYCFLLNLQLALSGSYIPVLWMTGQIYDVQVVLFIFFPLNFSAQIWSQGLCSTFEISRRIEEMVEYQIKCFKKETSELDVACQ